MAKDLVTRLLRVVLAAALTLAFAERASASSILLSNLQIHVDGASLIASFTAGLQAQSDVVDQNGFLADVFLDSLSVSLEQNGEPIPDLFVGPTLLDDAPFLALPFNLPHGGILPDDTLLFRITGLVAGAAYSGSFSLSSLGRTLRSSPRDSSSRLPRRCLNPPASFCSALARLRFSAGAAGAPR